MKVKKPKLSGSGYKHLGHFAKQKNISRGHNDSGSAADLLTPPSDLPDQTMAQNTAVTNQRRDNQSAVDKIVQEQNLPATNQSAVDAVKQEMADSAALNKRAAARNAQRKAMKGY